MDKVIEMIGSDFGWQNLAILFCLIVTGLPSFLKGWDYLCDRFHFETKGSRERKEQNQKCVVQAAAIKALEDKIAEYDSTNREHWQTSKSYQNSYAQSQQDIMDSIKELKDELKDMRKTTDERFAVSEARDNKRAMAELKDKIGERYRRYHAKGEINDMEYEALEDLIEEYESAGGENSFVHSVVQREMPTWTRI